MAKKKQLPLVAICGRPNVGKSTLFNRIIRKSRAIVHDLEGITRDRFFGEAEWNGKRFRVVDTGGIIEHPVDPISQKMQLQVRAALDEASVIVFVVDGQAAITRVDEQVRDELFKYGKPIVLAANKLDNPKMEEFKYEFFQLGVGEPHPVSSGHGIGMAELMDAVTEHVPDSPVEVDDPKKVTKVAVVGRPNVGKSSFINALLNEERTIVHDQPGTTRDAIDIEFNWKEKDYLLIDTAGMRRKAGIKAPVEHFSVSRTLRAMKRADVCLIMIEAPEGIAEQDKRIIGFALENGIAMVLVWTKWDLIEDKEKKFKSIPDEISLKFPKIAFVPYVTISNITRQRLFSVFEHIDRVAEAAEQRIPTASLNKLIEDVKAKHNPPSMKGKHAKILYATQASVKPTIFVLFVNQTRLFHFSYVRFIENQIREHYGFSGVPIKLELREGKPEK